MNDSATAGPALSRATCPVSTKMPVPTITPTPKTVRSSGPSARRSRCVGSSVPRIDCSTDFVRSRSSPGVSHLSALLIGGRLAYARLCAAYGRRDRRLPVKGRKVRRGRPDPGSRRPLRGSGGGRSGGADRARSGGKGGDPRLQEPAAGDPLGDAGPVEVGGDPAEVERPPGAEDHAKVDVLRGGDDPLVQHDADLVGERVERAG